MDAACKDCERAIANNRWTKFAYDNFIWGQYFSIGVE
jgi:hypothetical protein